MLFKKLSFDAYTDLLWNLTMDSNKYTLEDSRDTFTAAPLPEWISLISSIQKQSTIFDGDSAQSSLNGLQDKYESLFAEFKHSLMAKTIFANVFNTREAV